MSLLAQLRDCGLRVGSRDGLLTIEPRAALTDNLRDEIRAAKATLLHQLTEETLAARALLEQFRAALTVGRLRICANCSRFVPGVESLGRCTRYSTDTWSLVPSTCAGFAESKTPVAPEFLPDPDGARARARESAK